MMIGKINTSWNQYNLIWEYIIIFINIKTRDAGLHRNLIDNLNMQLPYRGNLKLNWTRWG